MKALWPLVVVAVALAGLLAIAFTLYFLGSIVGAILEFIIRAIPGLLYHLPSYFVAAFSWIGSVTWGALTNPLRTICVAVGMLLVVTYFRGVTGHFDAERTVFRGSRVRTADDVFPDLDESQAGFNAMRSRFRGSAISDADTLFEVPKEPYWSTLWQSIKSLFTRNSDGDDLP